MSTPPPSSPEHLATILQKCLADERVTNAITISSTALFFYDYCLTIFKEIRYVWKTKFTLANTLFILARYPALLTAILVLVAPKSSVIMSNLRSCLRVLTILSSELIFALRTWAIWGRRKSILVMFIGATIAGFVPSVIITVKDISTSMVDPSLPAQYTYCGTITSSVGKLWILPYLLIISYQLLTLIFTLIKISQLHRSLPKHARCSLLSTLQLDGILYFLSMLVLGAMNIGLIVQVSSPQLRQGGTQLQTIAHSIMSARIVFHIVETTSKDFTRAESSLEAVVTQYLTTHIEMENVVVSPPSDR